MDALASFGTHVPVTPNLGTDEFDATFASRVSVYLGDILDQLLVHESELEAVATSFLRHNEVLVPLCTNDLLDMDRRDDDMMVVLGKLCGLTARHTPLFKDRVVPLMIPQLCRLYDTHDGGNPTPGMVFYTLAASHPDIAQMLGDCPALLVVMRQAITERDTGIPDDEDDPEFKVSVETVGYIAASLEFMCPVSAPTRDAFCTVPMITRLCRMCTSGQFPTHETPTIADLQRLFTALYAILAHCPSANARIDTNSLIVKTCVRGLEYIEVNRRAEPPVVYPFATFRVLPVTIAFVMTLTCTPGCAPVDAIQASTACRAFHALTAAIAENKCWDASLKTVEGLVVPAALVPASMQTNADVGVGVGAASGVVSADAADAPASAPVPVHTARFITIRAAQMFRSGRITRVKMFNELDIMVTNAPRLLRAAAPDQQCAVCGVSVLLPHGVFPVPQQAPVVVHGLAPGAAWYHPTPLAPGLVDEVVVLVCGGHRSVAMHRGCLHADVLAGRRRCRGCNAPTVSCLYRTTAAFEEVRRRAANLAAAQTHASVDMPVSAASPSQ